MSSGRILTISQHSTIKQLYFKFCCCCRILTIERLTFHCICDNFIFFGNICPFNIQKTPTICPPTVPSTMDKFNITQSLYSFIFNIMNKDGIFIHWDNTAPENQMRICKGQMVKVDPFELKKYPIFVLIQFLAEQIGITG